MSKKKPTPDEFERSLHKGYSSYNQRVGTWWHDQSNNRAHKAAYKNICDYLKKSLPTGKKNPGYIVDYACGNGAFLKELALKFSKSKIVGYDGSSLMLGYAKERLSLVNIEAERMPIAKTFQSKGPRVRLAKTVLPNFNFPKHKADIAVFLFPNLTCAPKERNVYHKNGYRNRKDTNMCELLCRFREMDPEDEVDVGDPDELYDDLMTNKVISKNLRLLLKKGGYLIRTDYANAPRHELTDLTQWRTMFTEAALNLEIKGEISEILFDFLKSEYRRSSVILDVYHQTNSKEDMTGGYFSSVLKAV